MRSREGKVGICVASVDRSSQLKSGGDRCQDEHVACVCLSLAELYILASHPEVR